MATGAALGPNPNAPEWERDIVDSHEQIPRRRRCPSNEQFDRIAAQIHKRLRFREQDRYAGEPALPDERGVLEPRDPTPSSLGEQVDQHEAEVVAGEFILG